MPNKKLQPTGTELGVRKKKKSTLNKRNTLIISAIFFLTGCAVLERVWLVPRASRIATIPSGVSSSEMLDAFMNAAQNHFVSFGKPIVTFRDEETIEVGHWRKSNTAGYSGKAKINNTKTQLSFTVKGAGPYYTKLPVLSPSSPHNMKGVDEPLEYTANGILSAIMGSVEQ